MNKIKLIALDLDGTLLNSEKTISVANATALAEARAAGVQVVFDTGRPLISTMEYLRELDMTGPDSFSITCNGGLVQDGLGQVLDKQTMSYQDLCAIAAWTAAHDLPMDIISDERSYTVVERRPSILHYVNNTLTFCSVRFDEIPPTATFNKVILSADVAVLDEALAGLPADLREHFEFFKTRDILLEIMPKGIVKSYGLMRLCQHLGLEAREVLAMGDEGNDVPMLAWAGLGVAPANAIAEVKAAANVVSRLSNDEDAVAAAVRAYVL